MRDCTRLWLERINALYIRVKESPLPGYSTIREVLFDANARTSTKERMLLALIDHPDPRATSLLQHQALFFDHPRLRFVHRLAIRRRLRRCPLQTEVEHRQAA